MSVIRRQHLRWHARQLGLVQNHFLQRWHVPKLGRIASSMQHCEQSRFSSFLSLKRGERFAHVVGPARFSERQVGESRQRPYALIADAVFKVSEVNERSKRLRRRLLRRSAGQVDEAPARRLRVADLRGRCAPRSRFVAPKAAWSGSRGPISARAPSAPMQLIPRSSVVSSTSPESACAPSLPMLVATKGSSVRQVDEARQGPRALVADPSPVKVERGQVRRGPKAPCAPSAPIALLPKGRAWSGSRAPTSARAPSTPISLPLRSSSRSQSSSNISWERALAPVR